MQQNRPLKVVTWLGAAQDTVDIGRRPPKLVDGVGTVAHETTSRHEGTVEVDREAQRLVIASHKPQVTDSHSGFRRVRMRRYVVRY